MLLFVVLYSMTALELDPGNIGDDFGDIYDTYLPHEFIKKATSSPHILISTVEPAALVWHPRHKTANVLAVLDEPHLELPVPVRRTHLLCSVWRL